MDQEQSIKLISDEGEGAFRVILVENLNPLVEEIGADVEVENTIQVREMEESQSPRRKRMKINIGSPVIEHHFSVDDSPLAAPSIIPEPWLHFNRSEMDSNSSDNDSSSSESDDENAANKEPLLEPQLKKICLTADNHQQIIGELSTEISNIERNGPNNKLEIELSLYSDSLNQLDSRARICIIQRFLNLFGKYIVKLGLKVHGEEYYLLQNQYRLPNLKTLIVSCPSYEMFPIASQIASQILQQLLIVYGRMLKTLEVTGVWNFDVHQEGYYPVEALETLHLTRSFPATLQSLLILYGSFVSTLELYDIMGMGDEIEGEECYMSNLKHLHIDADSMSFFELIRCNTDCIESLIIFCDDPEMDYNPGGLDDFKNLKLLEVNCPMVLNAILECCNRKLKYLYVPEQGENAVDQIPLSPIHLPGLKDLCVRGTKKWSVDMIRAHRESLENLIIFGFMELDEFRESEEYENDNEYYWPDLAALSCRFPKMKKLLLPDCTDNNIIESLTAKCPGNVEVITGKKEVGAAVEARINQSYSYKRYKRMMHRNLSSLFQFN